MTRAAKSTRTLQQSLEAVARGRFVMPIVLVLGMLTIAVNESTYQHSRTTLNNGIALTDARVKAAETLQLLTDAGLYARFLRGFAQARGVKTATHTMELRIGRDGTLERVLMFDDAADPYQLHNLAPEEHPALFAALCRELAVLLRDNDDVWFREGVLSDVVPYDTNN